jgi:hypothetical protein
MGDVVATLKATPSVSLGASVDVAREGRPIGDPAHWAGVGLYARYQAAESRTAFAVRGEYYDDDDGAISGTPQTLKEITATVEHKPVPNLSLKLEGRYDKSSADVFLGEQRGIDGPTLLKDSQFLVLFGVVASF